MIGDVNEIICDKCGRYLFTEIDTIVGYARYDDSRNYIYYPAKDLFICNDCKYLDFRKKTHTDKELEEII